MGKLFLEILSGERIYTCECLTHLSHHSDIVSKAFQGRHGRAYLFANVVNVSTGTREERVLLTGIHIVADVYCNSCQRVVGWKYEEAYEESQKYKEGKFILEKAKIRKEMDWKTT